LEGLGLVWHEHVSRALFIVMGMATFAQGIINVLFGRVRRVCS
jgi:hypothetical protein